MDFADFPLDIKQLNDTGHIEGLAAAFGNVDHGGDKMLFGSVTKTLAARGEAPLPMLFAHDQRRPIGAWRSWQERPEGLYVKGNITLATRDGQEAYALAKDGALGGISIGYKSIKERPEGKARQLHEVALHEASLVAIPLNDRARVLAVKSIGSARDIAELLHEAGFSDRRAKLAAGMAWKALNEQPDEAAADAELAALIKASTARLAKKGQ